MSLSLYSISEEYKYLLDRLFSEETGEIDMEIAKRLDELEKPLQEKALNKVRFMKSLEAEYAAIKAEREAMQTREKALKSKIDWFKLDVLNAMERSSINEISCTQFVIKLRKNPDSVDLDFDFDGEDKYWRIKKEPNLAAIKEDLKAGIMVPGARLANTNRIEIK